MNLKTQLLPTNLAVRWSNNYHDRGVALLESSSGECFAVAQSSIDGQKLEAIAHAANAYPQLVAALKALYERCESGMLINHPQACAEHREENAKACGDALELLTSLGESKQ